MHKETLAPAHLATLCVSMALFRVALQFPNVTIECELSRLSRQDLVAGRQCISFKAQIGSQHAELGLIEKELWRHAVGGVHVVVVVTVEREECDCTRVPETKQRL